MSIPGKEGRPASDLEKRVRTVETKLNRLRLNKRSGCRSGQLINNGAADSLGQLEELQQEAQRIEEQAEASEDYRTALAAIRERCRIVELKARLRGELDERSQTNVLNVHLDSDTVKRIAETYLARHRPFELEAE